MHKPLWSVAVLAAGLSCAGVAALGVLASPSAQAQTAAAVRKQVEATMLLTGHLDIDAGGRVQGYVIEQKDLEPGIAALLARSVPLWTFQPGAAGRETMSLRLVANQIEGSDGAQGMRVRLASAHFGTPTPTDAPTPLKQTPIQYPMDLARSNVSGTAYLLVRVGRDGRILDAVAEQVNLRAVSNERAMRQMRDAFARASLVGVRKWTYKPPTTGAAVDAPHWDGRIVVDFTLDKDGEGGPGTWSAYVPGPRTDAPWVRDAQAGNDALLAGAFYPLDTGRRLTSALEPAG